MSKYGMDGVDKAFFGVMILIILGVIAFWSTVVWIVLHFIFKFW